MTGGLDQRFTRRDVLKGATAAAVMLGTGTGLAACSSGSSGTTTSTSPAGSPQRPSPGLSGAAPSASA